MDLPSEDYNLILRIGDPFPQLVVSRGDITLWETDAIVNAANSELVPGGGVSGAIHRAGGPVIGEECRKIRGERGPLATGQAAATAGGRLRAKYVIHTVGPVWQGGNHGESELLASCYRESVRVADELKLHSIAFPAISTGIFGYPVEQAAWVAVPMAIESLRSAKHVGVVQFVLFDRPSFDIFAKVTVAQRRPASGRPYEITSAIVRLQP
jgi:O-acetyl-ADP-ribose deacetylase